MVKIDLAGLEQQISTVMNAKRYRHTLGVMYTAAALAMRFAGEEREDFIHRTMIAGLLHDNAKCTLDEELLDFCVEHGIEVTPCERANAFLLHGKVGAYLAREEYGIDDTDILNAITWHTTGRPGMSLMEKIVFVADYIEPGRYKQKNLSKIRELAFTDLDVAVYQIASDTVDYITENNKSLDDMTVKTRDYYKR